MDVQPTGVSGQTPEISLTSLCLILFIVLAFTFALLSTLKHETADEGFHTPVIYMWHHGRFEKPDNLTVQPVYHGMVAGLMHVLDLNTVKSMRFITLLLSVFSIPAFYLLCKHLQQTQIEVRTLQFVLLPVILPFFSLVYTDIPSLSFTLGFILLMFKGWHWTAGAIALIAVFMRQTNLVWVGFCGLYILVDSWVAHEGMWKERVRTVLKTNFLKLLPYALVSVALFSFAIYNKGLSAGDAELQQLAFNPSNIYFFLLLCFFFFLPYNFEYSQRIYTLLSRSLMPWAIIACALLLYLATYNNHHQYNSYGLSFYLRNIILHHSLNTFIVKLLSFVAISWMGLTFFLMTRTSERPWQLAVFFIAATLSMLPLPLVEQRYYIPALCLFLAFKPTTHPVSDKLVLLTFIPISAWLVYGIAQFRFFL